MKPKMSTGYFTPQFKKTRQPTKQLTPESQYKNKNNVVSDFDDKLFESLMKCPQKKKMILELLASNKQAIKDYKEKGTQKAAPSPVNKLKNKIKCESPTALLRRRALEQMNTNSSDSSNHSLDSGPNSRLSRASSSSVSPVPFEKIFDGVIAYVEIISKDRDRSEGVKEVLKSMGAKVNDMFSRDVTHVVFKDGSFTTYQKAKLLKIPLVSVLWVEFSRKFMHRQDEKEYSAIKSGYFDEPSMVCSQMEKEYNEVIRQEYRRSIIEGTPLPEIKTLVNRRRTLMTPIVSSTSSFETASECNQEQCNKVSKINGFNADGRIDQYLILNDPGCFSEVSGAVIDGDRIEKNNDKNISDKNETSAVKVLDKNIGNDDIYEQRTPKLLTMRNVGLPRRKTICNSLISSDKSSKSSKEDSLVVSRGSLIKPNSNLLELEESLVLGRNVVKSSKFVSKEKKNMEGSSVMSDLHLSSEKRESRQHERHTRKSKSVSELHLKESMSNLNLFSEESKNRTEGSAMSSLRVSSEGLNRNAKVGSINCSGNKGRGYSRKTSLQVSHEQLAFEERDNSTNKSTMSSLRVSSEGVNKDVEMAPTDSTQRNTRRKFQNSKLVQNLHLSVELERKEKSVSSMPDFELETVKDGADSGLKKSSRLNKHVTSVEADKQVVEGSVLCNNSICSSENSSNISLRRKSSVNSFINSSGLSSRGSSSSNIRHAVDDAIRSLETSGFITVRRKVGHSSNASSALDLDDSEIKSPKKSVRKSLFKRGTRRQYSSSSDKVESDKDLNKSVSQNNNNTSSNADKQLIVKVLKSPEINNCSKEELKKKGLRKGSLATGLRSKSKNQSSSDSTKQKRKLYNPDDPIAIEVDDEEERRQKRWEVRKRKSDQKGIIPAHVLHVGRNKEISDKNKENSDDNIVALSDSDSTPSPPKRKSNGKKQASKPISLNSSVDEQTELLNEIISKRTEPKTVQHQTPQPEAEKRTLPLRRRSMRLSRSVVRYGFEQGESSDEGCEVPTKPINRRSTLDFQPSSQAISVKKTKKSEKLKTPSIVCTKLHKADVQVFTQIVKKLKRFIVEEEVSNRTTHVVAGEPKRTINMLRAISRGCWVLKYEWVLRSLENGKWLPEEDYEITEFSSVVQKSRLQRQAFGAKYTLNVFEGCGPIFVALSTNPRCSDLKELITLCKGRVVSNLAMAKIVVGMYIPADNVVCVNETWVLDCITFDKKMSFKHKYLLKQKTGRVSIAV